jgi:hypothetical protein
MDPLVQNGILGMMLHDIMFFGEMYLIAKHPKINDMGVGHLFW